MKISIKIGEEGRGIIELDGRPVMGIKSFDIRARAGYAPEVSFTVVGDVLEFEAAKANIKVTK